MIMTADAMRRAWMRVAHEVIERNGAETAVVLAGIPTRGVPLAQRLMELVAELGGRAEVLELVVEGHRDDRGGLAGAALPAAVEAVDIEDRVVVLVDDVVFHGRTARAALDALTELGRPAAVQLAVLVDRGHRELPIRADFVGKNIPTHASDRVEVRVEEVDGEDGVWVIGGHG
jgi:pyrimidine operon attenuation protein/uracil phosphoribosyltransferase